MHKQKDSYNNWYLITGTWTKTSLSSSGLPVTSPDPTYTLHRTLLHLGFLYIDLRNVGKMGHTSLEVLAATLISTECKIAKLVADLPKHIAYNSDGKPGHGKPIDQLMEHYNLYKSLTSSILTLILTIVNCVDMTM